MVDLSGVIVAGGTAQDLVAASPIPLGSLRVQVQNLDSSEDLWVREDGVASAGSGSIKVPPGALYESPYGSTSTTASIFSTKTGHAFTARRW